MVFLNDKKYACESCIKGHRSSSCHHNERPLFEVKKKGRPVSQCETCRSLRHSKKMHSKCLCQTEDLPKPSPAIPRNPALRTVPSIPTLPNGIADLTHDDPSSNAQFRDRLRSLMNPCRCKSLYECDCHLSSGPSQDHDRLSALANAAFTSSQASSSKKTQASRPRSTTPPQAGQKKRKKLPRANLQILELHLPPILDEPPPPTPDFETIPPFEAVHALAGTGCTCGLECKCPGCVEHRGPEHVCASSGQCADGACTTCVDPETDVGCLQPGSSFEKASGVLLNQFLARAAALPSPATTRKAAGAELDPGNILVYPADIFDGKKEKGAAFGCIRVPKLECCGGKCSCQPGECSCGALCDGCCQTAAPVPSRSCCSSK